MSKPNTEDEFERFRVKRDAAMMHKGLNELDPFVGHSPATRRKAERSLTSAA
jgi:hypothetical protein